MKYLKELGLFLPYIVASIVAIVCWFISKDVQIAVFSGLGLIFLFYLYISLREVYYFYIKFRNRK